ncbi:MAG: ribonuclease Z [Candidatus Thorarchaeota archaeon]|nr:ribonuclease Z [Candidatus Thorarchaeota archaeon]
MRSDTASEYRMFEIIFLGTGGSIPTEGRNHPAIAIRFQGSIFLFDAGEDVQRQFVRAGLGLNHPMFIFISHTHADHVIGLPGLLLRMALLGRQRPLRIFGPSELIDYVKAVQASIGLGTTYDARVYAIQPGTVLEDDGIEVTAFPVSHRGTTFGYGLSYTKKMGRFHPERAQALGVPKGPLWHQLATGHSVEVNGRTISPEEVAEPPPPPLKIVYSGDTRPCDSLRDAIKDTHVFICEAMYASDKAEMADERGHMTARQAAELARDAQVQHLALTHYSPRYELENGSQILQEAQAIFPATTLAHDLMRIRLSWNGIEIQSASDK